MKKVWKFNEKRKVLIESESHHCRWSKMKMMIMKMIMMKMMVMMFEWIILYLSVFWFAPLDGTTVDHTIYVTAIIRLCRCRCYAKMMIIARILQIMALVHISVVNR